MNAPHVDLGFQGAWYVFFYVLAFQAGLVYLIAQGNKLNIPRVPWLLTILVSFLFFMVGCKLFLFSAADWNQLLRTAELPDISGRSLLGGIVLGFGAIIFAIRWFRLPQDTLDAFALLVPVALLLQRCGCFFAGCCYGKVCELPWGVTYGQGYHAFDNHVANGLIASDAISSLPVHPVQLYELIGCLIIIFMIEIFRKRKVFRVPGSLLLCSGILYAGIRFFDEFFRHSVSLGTFLNRVQVLVLIMAMVSTALLLLNERRMVHRQGIIGENRNRRSLPFLLLIVIIFSAAQKLLGTLEVLSLYPVLILTTMAMIHEAFVSMTSRELRFPTVALTCLTVLLMSQKAEEDPQREVERSHYYTVAMSVLTGNHTLVDEQTIAEDCDGNSSYVLARFKEKYTSGSLSFSKSQVTGQNTLTYGLRGQVGKLNETGEDNISSKRSMTFYGVNPFVQYDMKRFGVGGGVHVGDMPLLRSEFDQNEATLIRRYRAYPQVYLRGGNLSKFFGEFRFGDGIGGTYPASMVQLTFGYGFHRDSGAAIRIGTSSHAGVLFSSTIPASRNIWIEPYLGVGGSLFTVFSEESNFQGAVRIAYRIDGK